MNAIFVDSSEARKLVRDLRHYGARIICQCAGDEWRGFCWIDEGLKFRISPPATLEQFEDAQWDKREPAKKYLGCPLNMARRYFQKFLETRKQTEAKRVAMMKELFAERGERGERLFHRSNSGGEKAA